MDEKELKKLIKETKKLNILYVEDNKEVMNSTINILNIFFTNIDTAENGLDGLHKFKEKSENYDLIISDINMPKMNGLDMIKGIRELNREIPVVVTTAFNDNDYLLKSIEIKIDRYLMKPISIKQMMVALSDISKVIVEKKMLEELLEEKLLQELKAKEEETIQKITNLYTTPTVIFRDKKLIHFSDSFADLIDNKDEKSLYKVTLNDYSMFTKAEGFMSSFEDYDEDNKENNKVSISKKIGKRIYRVYKKNIDFNDSIDDIYIFVNITQEEYLKVKINSYVNSLEKLVIKTQKLKISEDKQRLLRNNKKHDEKLTAKELIEQIDHIDLQELQELHDLDSDLYDSMEKFENGDFNELMGISKLLERYAGTIYPVVEFENLYVAIYSLAKQLASIDFSTVNETKYTMFFLYLRSIREDLAGWRKHVFVEQTTNDIHYLDASLISTALQLEVLISENSDDIESDEDDLEFF
ncbi:MAG: response regulator [Campylobacterota bacterium]|nr:response regulator [Campylobacterota bacterium]